MADSGPPRNIRRDSRLGPSPLRHGIMAVIIILCAIASAYMLLGMLKKSQSNNQRSVSKIPITTSDVAVTPLVDDLEISLTEEKDLPDLIAPDIDNPTEKLAGALAIADSKAAAPKDDNSDKTPKPRTIRINGQPAGKEPATPLIKAPIAGLSKPSPYGAVPSKGTAGQTAFKSYAKPYTIAGSSKPAAIIVGGLGLNAQVTTRAILDLPEQVTLSFAAHSPQLQSYIDLARKNGHEVLLELPMEANGAAPNPVTRTLTVSRDASENSRNLNWLLSRASGYFAVMNYNGDKLLTRSDIIAPLMSDLNDAGLGFIFDKSFSAVALPALATSAKLPFIEGDIVLDEIDSQAITSSNLSNLGARAIAGEKPIAIGFAYPSTIKAISAWAIDAPDRGIVLVPASHLMTP